MFATGWDIMKKKKKKKKKIKKKKKKKWRKKEVKTRNLYRNTTAHFQTFQ